MHNRIPLLVGTALFLTAATSQAQDIKIGDVKVGGVIQVWYNQVLDSNLRNDSATLATTAGKRTYYNLRSDFKEDGGSLRRAELQFSGKITDTVGYYVMIDPSINTSTSNPTILQDVYISYKPFKGLEFRVGQFKNQQTYEGILFGSGDILFAERSQVGRVFGDVRDRGAMASYTFGDPKEFSTKFTVGLFNGGASTTKTLNKDGSITATTTNIAKTGDVNAQKDYTLRVDMSLGTMHKFGAYTLQGQTDYANSGSNPLVPRTFTAGSPAPDSAIVLDNKDKTTNLGAYYAFAYQGWQASAEYITGLLGRRFPTLENTKTSDYTGTLPASWAIDTALREHLDQKFEGYCVTGGYTFGAHTLLARYDFMNYNKGDKWYTRYNPYTTKTDGTPILVNGAPVDYTPKYREVTLGYTYAFKPDKVKAANIKLNYIMRSKNFLAPGAGQTGEQGGDNIVAAFQVAF